jgi:hypothetical protein
MPQHHHPSRRGAQHYGAVLAGALLSPVTRRRHHPRHRFGRVRHPLTGGRWGPSHRAGRRGRRWERWSR